MSSSLNIIKDGDLSQDIFNIGINVTSTGPASNMPALQFISGDGFTGNQIKLGPNTDLIDDANNNVILNLQTAIHGTESNATDLGEFTGTIITDNVHIKQALQDVETYFEGGFIELDSFIQAGVPFDSPVTTSAAEISADVITCPSDRRLKTNINKIENPLDKVNKINGYNFNWIDSDKPDVGVIAQEIEEVYPEVVKSSSNDGYKRVDYGKIVPLLIESIKELSKKVDDLQAQLNSQ